MMKRLVIFITALLLFVSYSCKDEWDLHYNEKPETVDQNVWEAIQNDKDLSKFVQIVKDYKIDTLFDSDIVYSVFIPTNEAIDNFYGEENFNEVILNYHFCSHFINTSSINGQRTVQTLTKKFALLEKNNQDITIDRIAVDFQSPLYINGRYFKINEVNKPKPNIYEYYDFTNDILTQYIDEQDTIIIDKEKSKPIGFDENGNTVYDTVATVENKFEWDYFPVKHEFREAAATLVFPDEEEYNNALDEMAEKLGGNYLNHEDIPIEWQKEILVPYLLYQGVFHSRLEPEDFGNYPLDSLKLLNVLGDSVVITYSPTNKALCSNGYAYSYEDFKIADSLYIGNNRFEGEDLIIKIGNNTYSWKEGVTEETSEPVKSIKEYYANASNDTILHVAFPSKYNGSYSLEFNGSRLFPKKYLMVVRTNINTGGIYNIYVNGELIRTFNYDDYARRRGIIKSVTGKWLKPANGYNDFDMWVDNITEYGKPKIKFEYVGPGYRVLTNGLIIDYIDFIAVDN